MDWRLLSTTVFQAKRESPCSSLWIVSINCSHPPWFLGSGTLNLSKNGAPQKCSGRNTHSFLLAVLWRPKSSQTGDQKLLLLTRAIIEWVVGIIIYGQTQGSPTTEQWPSASPTPAQVLAYQTGPRKMSVLAHLDLVSALPSHIDVHMDKHSIKGNIKNTWVGFQEQ